MSIRRFLIGSLVGANLLCLASVPAMAETQTFVDLQAGLGYSTNPLLRLGDDVDSAYGRLSAYGFHGWTTERSSTSLSAYVENSTYFRRYSNRQLLDLAATTSRQASERVRVFGSLGFSTDFGGQLSSRFYGAPSGSLPTDPTVPSGSVIVVNPDLAALNQRQYRLSGQFGADFTLSARDTLSTSVGAQRVFFSGDGDFLDYNQYDANVAYRRQLSERLSVGARLIANHADYSLGRSITSYGPQATIETRISEQWDVTGALGFVRTERDFAALGGKDSSFDLAADASICRNLEYERMCARASRRTQSSVLGAAPSSTSISGEYSRRLSARDQVQASLALVRTGAVRELSAGKQTFYTLAGSYDRKINDRFSAGVNVSARKLSALGPDPKSDFGGSIFVRHRIGSLR